MQRFVPVCNNIYLYAKICTCRFITYDSGYQHHAVFMVSTLLSKFLAKEKKILAKEISSAMMVDIIIMLLSWYQLDCQIFLQRKFLQTICQITACKLQGHWVQTVQYY